VLDREISVKHVGVKRTTLTNHSPRFLIWRASFPPTAGRFLIDGKLIRDVPIDLSVTAPPPRDRASTGLKVEPGATRTVEIVA
jgi:hypothetical protein